MPMTITAACIVTGTVADKCKTILTKRNHQSGKRGRPDTNIETWGTTAKPGECVQVELVLVKTTKKKARKG
ncbi:MAG: hypothetical protein KGL39_57470 [Patescibacteria group bacterium]|nr:hypothetical protein [Patescibacteria group bacterium]